MREFLIIITIMIFGAISIMIDKMLYEMKYKKLFENKEFDKIPINYFIKFAFLPLINSFPISELFSDGRKYVVIRVIKHKDYDWNLVSRILISVMRAKSYDLKNREENSYCFYFEFSYNSTTLGNSNEFNDIKLINLGDYEGLLEQIKHDIEVIEKTKKDYLYLIETGANFDLKITNDEIKQKYDDTPDFFYKILSALAFNTNNYKKVEKNIESRQKNE